MSLVITFKAFDGLVLAADSRSTPYTGKPEHDVFMPRLDNHAKLFRVPGQDFIGVLAYGLLTIGRRLPRGLDSLLREFGATLGSNRQRVDEVATCLGAFLLGRWNAAADATSVDGMCMCLLVAGINAGEPHGRVYHLEVPGAPVPQECKPGSFGVMSAGQNDVVQRLVYGFDPRFLESLSRQLRLSTDQAAQLRLQLCKDLLFQVPETTLPLADAVDLCAFLIRTTIDVQRWYIRPQTVGGAVQLATITEAAGFQFREAASSKGDPCPSS